MKGFFGRILRVDATSMQFQYEHLGGGVLSRTLGGKGLGTSLLWVENPPGVGPLDPAFGSQDFEGDEFGAAVAAFSAPGKKLSPADGAGCIQPLPQDGQPPQLLRGGAAVRPLNTEVIAVQVA